MVSLAEAEEETHMERLMVRENEEGDVDCGEEDEEESLDRGVRAAWGRSSSRSSARAS